MTNKLSSAEESQLLQTIEMFEVITQSQPNDYQSLEILKEAYAKLGREKEAVSASKRIAEAYVAMGQLSLAILEYEMILQRYPEDKEVQLALNKLENKTNIGQTDVFPDPEVATKKAPVAGKAASSADVDDGKQMMFKLFVEGKVISSGEFESCWPNPNNIPAGKVSDPFIQVLAEKGSVPIDKSLRLLADKTRLGFLPMDKYDIDVDMARTFTRELCQKWCILPFDRMGKTVLVATANPFNKEVVRQMEKITNNRILWYLSLPIDLVRGLNKIFR